LASFGRFWQLFKLYLAPSCAGTYQPWLRAVGSGKIWLITCRKISKISILKDMYLENRFIYNKLEAILFEEMRRIDLLWEIVKYTASFL
jgi:hypothetical protein